MAADFKRVIRPGGPERGQVVGRYSIEGGKVELLIEKFETDFRRSMEFILSHSPYTESDLRRKDFLTFFRILGDCEAAERDRVKNQSDG